MEHTRERLRPFVERAREGGTLFGPVPLGDPLPWDFARRAAELLPLSKAVLALGPKATALLAGEHEISFAVAAYGPHDEPSPPIPGVTRVRLSDLASPPFAANSFDLVMALETPFDPAAVTPLVAPGGAILSQQAHPRDWFELREHFPRMPEIPDLYARLKETVRKAGFELLDARTHSHPVAFQGLGPLAYTLAARPHILPDFSLDADVGALLALEAKRLEERGILLTQARFIIEARRPREAE